MGLQGKGGHIFVALMFLLAGWGVDGFASSSGGEIPVGWVHSGRMWSFLLD